MITFNFELRELKMDMTSVAKLQKKSIFISPLIVNFFEIYSEDIRPFLGNEKDKNLNLEQRRALFKPTILIKSKEKQLLANNFEIYYLLKSHNLDQETLRLNMFVSSLTDDQLNFNTAFFELIDIVSRYKVLLDLKVILGKLQKILTKDKTQSLLKKNDFSAAIFCKLICLSEQAYHARNKRSG